jgi:transposase-like protein
MDTQTAFPKTLLEAIKYFQNPDVGLVFLRDLRWPNGVVCPTCGSPAVTFLANARVWKCRVKHDRQKFSIKVGTIFEDSPISLDKWLPAVWQVVNCKNGISSCEMARALGVTQKTAWFMDHRVRLAMHDGTFEKAKGQVEVDETFIGGKARNMHVAQRKRRITGTGGKGKTAVVGFLERGGKVQTVVVENRRKKIMQEEVKKRVEAGSALYTDELLSYEGLAGEYAHKVINHAVQYVDGAVHTNTLENFWSLLKRGINGTYVSIEPFHLFRYLDEQAFRFNQRELNDSERFVAVCGNLVGKRLTYRQLIGQPEGMET